MDLLCKFSHFIFMQLFPSFIFFRKICFNYIFQWFISGLPSFSQILQYKYKDYNLKTNNYVQINILVKKSVIKIYKMKSKLKICIEFWNIDLNLLLLMSLCIEDNCFGGLNICLDKADRRSVHKGWSQVHAVNGSIDCTQSHPHPVRFCWHPLVLFLQILNKKINFGVKFF